MFENIFGNSVVRKVEERKKLLSKVELFKKQQKVEAERIAKEFSTRKQSFVDSVDAQIVSLKAQIESLKQLKKDKSDILDEKCKVELDKALNKFNGKIITTSNKAKKIGYYVEAEQKNLQDVLNPEQPNAPKNNKVLVEEKTSKK